MRKKLLLAGLFFASGVSLLLTLPANSQEKKEETIKYVGIKKCKMCHKKQYDSWKKTKHAKALASLSEKGDDKNTDCLGCHTTGYGKPKKEKVDLSNVQCEVCHGPGEKYIKMSVMKDPAKAKEAGCIKPDEKTCRRCHNEKSPNFRGFDYKEYIKKGIHEHKKKEKE